MTTTVEWEYGMAEALGSIREILNKWTGGKLTSKESMERVAWAIVCLDLCKEKYPTD